MNHQQIDSKKLKSSVVQGDETAANKHFNNLKSSLDTHNYNAEYLKGAPLDPKKHEK